MRKRQVVAAGLIAGVVLAGCGSGGESTGDGDSDLTIAVVELAASIEPWAQAGHPGQYMWGATYDALTRIDPEGRPAPALAESWRAVDSVTWEFTLRQGVTFQNGEPLNAEAVVATFEYLLSEEGRGEYASHTSNYSYITEVAATDERTVVITTEDPRPLVPSDVSVVFIVPPALLAEGIDAFRAAPAGTGPFRPVEWTSERIVLEPWADSWREAPDVASLTFVSISDPAARYQALQAGDADVIIGLSPDQEARLADGFGAWHETVGRMMSIKYIQNRGGPIADPDVRKALNLAVNRESINENLLLDRATISAWPPPGVDGHDPSRPSYEYDPQQARQLLADAGYPDGFSMTIEATMDSWDADRQAYEVIQADLAAIGVELEIVEIDFATDWLPKHNGAQEWIGEGYSAVWISAPQYDGFRPMGWYASCDWPAQTFCDPDMQAEIDAARTELDLEARAAHFDAAFDLLVDNPAALMLFDLPQVWGYGPRVANFESYSVNIDWPSLELA